MRIFTILRNCPLFSGINEPDFYRMLDCLKSSRKQYKKNAFIYEAEDKISSFGIVLNGAVHILREDYWGNRRIVARIEEGGIFGEAFACAEIERLPVSVIAVVATVILLLSSRRIFETCSSACVFHTNLIKNLTLLLAQKNVSLVQKLEHITQPSTREKILSYLSEQAMISGRNSFSIPFNREELADFLSVDRSAMSAELSRMKDDKLLEYRKNHFILKNEN